MILVMDNAVVQKLCDLGVCDEKYFRSFYRATRDRPDIGVMRCEKSGVIFTSTSKHMDEKHYSEMADLDYWGSDSLESARASTFEDDLRRKNNFESLLSGKKWLDFGAGNGGLMKLAKGIPSKIVAIEPQKEIQALLKTEGFQVYSSLSDSKERDFEVVTLFHVLEHLTSPVDTLIELRKKMKPGGKIIVEVPHARDFLFSFLDLEEFKAFTFWSEHIVLHTRDSLTAFMRAAGFKNIDVAGFQRYPLANHLYWLKEKKPGGHKIWSCLESKEMDAAYSKLLGKLDMTDTIICVAEA